MKQAYIVCCLLLLISIETYSQSLNGVWQGKLTQEPGGCFPEYFIELQINEFDYFIEGVSYDFYDTATFVKLNFSGTVTGGGKKIIKISEKKILQERIPEECVPCMKTYTLVYARKNNEESLSGQWEGEDMGTIAGCPPGNIYLKRVTSSAFAPKKERKTTLAHTVYVNSPDVHIAFYDNGDVDGDSITVRFDNEAIINNKALSVKPLEANITLQPSKEHQLLVIAETLGKIPPNTSVLVITAGKKRYELMLSANEENNTSIRIIYGYPKSSESELKNLIESNPVK